MAAEQPDMVEVVPGGGLEGAEDLNRALRRLRLVCHVLCHPYDAADGVAPIHRSGNVIKTREAAEDFVPRLEGLVLTAVEGNSRGSPPQT